MTDKQNDRRLILPPSATVSRRQALKMGVAGIGGLAVGGSLLAACGDDEEAAPATTRGAGHDRGPDHGRACGQGQDQGRVGVHRPARRQRLDPGARSGPPRRAGRSRRPVGDVVRAEHRLRRRDDRDVPAAGGRRQRHHLRQHRVRRAADRGVGQRSRHQVLRDQRALLQRQPVPVLPGPREDRLPAGRGRRAPGRQRPHRLHRRLPHRHRVQRRERPAARRPLR